MNTEPSVFWDKNGHQRMLMLAAPMILSNITTPLLGMVDTAVMGHMGAVEFVAGASIGAMILTQLYWICGFLRMTVTGLSAQSLGQQSLSQSYRYLFQSVSVGLFLGLIFVLFQSQILSVGLMFASSSPQVTSVIGDYFNVRVWGAPAALANMALMGWLIGQQKVKVVMWLQIIANSLNVVLDIWLVFGLNAGVEGVALASICAEYFILIAGGYMAWSCVRSQTWSKHWLTLSSLKPFLGLNSDMLLRNLALQACLAFITFYSARLGDIYVAVNAIIMQFFVLSALGLDGIAQATEALVGQSKGARQPDKLVAHVLRGVFWSSVVAVLCSVIFYLGATPIVSLLTDIEELRQHSLAFKPIFCLIPLIGHWCFLFDGVFIGLTRGKAMRNSMLLGCVLVFFPVWAGLSAMENWALWIAMLGFLCFRGVSLGGYFSYLRRRQALLD